MPDFGDELRMVKVMLVVLYSGGTFLLAVLKYGDAKQFQKMKKNKFHSYYEIFLMVLRY